MWLLHRKMAGHFKADYPERVTLVEFVGLGHFMVRERPDLIADAITAFMQKLAR
jgi:pimeloyl-ACP methyl ester carboxylesterase